MGNHPARPQTSEVDIARLRRLQQHGYQEACTKAAEACGFHFEVKPNGNLPEGSYDVELKGLDGAVELRVTRTTKDFERMWKEMSADWLFIASSGLTPAPPPLSGAPVSAAAVEQAPAATSTSTAVQQEEEQRGVPPPALKHPCAELQRWLNELACDDLLLFSQAMQDFLGISGPSGWPAPTAPSLTMVAECHEPLLLELVGYLADRPQDLTRFGCCASRSMAKQVEFAIRHAWRDMYAARWPTFAECLQHQGLDNWRRAYKETALGKCECTLEVFDREKKLGFAMAAMAARVQFEAGAGAGGGSYVARYLSASEVKPEMIPYHEGHRLRFCPPSARPQLKPGTREAVAPGCTDERTEAAPHIGAPSKVPQMAAYPYRVLEGFDGLRVGQGVELQWKMQFGSPFGWWFGHLEEMRMDPDGKTAMASLTFRHFPANSRWYRLSVRFGDDELRPCTFGGFTGGIRAVSEEEHRRWMRFFPKEPVVF